MMKTKRGDVVLVLFPNSDLRTAKRRPALVLQRDNLASGLDQTDFVIPHPHLPEQLQELVNACARTL
jgi:mRNA-degrading endonuclease toxin of MazEF toxin-antitoxin module